MKLSLIFATADNDVIGNSGKLPWRLPKDFAHFKKTTLGHPIIMGRITFEQDAGILPGRQNIVISRNADARKRAIEKGADACGSLDEALALLSPNCAQCFVIGGAQIYKLALPLATDIWCTRVHTEATGNTYLPEIPWDEYTCVSTEKHLADEKNIYDFSIEHWQRNL